MFKINTLIVISLFGLSACGGGGGGSVAERPVLLDGIFKDSNVTGLSYVSGDQSAKTDEGKFKYEEGDDITFMLGGIDFGTALAKPVMTPVDLVAGGTLSHTEVVNRVRLLMMLDEDNIPSNGIVISSAVQKEAEEWGLVDFSSDYLSFLGNVNEIQYVAQEVDGVFHPLPDADVAIAHLKTTLLCSSSGAFVGDYVGTETGNFAFILDPVTGKVTGSSFNSMNVVSKITSAEEVIYEDDFSFVSVEDEAKTYTGKLDSVNSMTGDWVDAKDSTVLGAFSGFRVGGSIDASYRYTVTFDGDEDGIYTFDVSDDKNVTGISYNVKTKVQSTLEGTVDNNKLTAIILEDGTEITGFIDEDKLGLTGGWDNYTEGTYTQGGISGGGCKLN